MTTNELEAFLDLNINKLFIETNTFKVVLLTGGTIDEDGNLEYELFDFQNETTNARVDQVELIKIGANSKIFITWWKKFHAEFEVTE
jgi:hypothetical protein